MSCGPPSHNGVDSSLSVDNNNTARLCEPSIARGSTNAIGSRNRSCNNRHIISGKENCCRGSAEKNRQRSIRRSGIGLVVKICTSASDISTSSTPIPSHCSATRLSSEKRFRIKVLFSLFVWAAVEVLNRISLGTVWEALTGLSHHQSDPSQGWTDASTSWQGDSSESVCRKLYKGSSTSHSTQCEHFFCWNNSNDAAENALLLPHPPSHPPVPSSSSPSSCCSFSGPVLFAAAQLRVLEPEGLFNDLKANNALTEENQFTLIGSTATFGVPNYGRVIMGRAFYEKDSPREGHTGNHCDMAPYCEKVKSRFEAFRAARGSNQPVSPFRIIIIVDRGYCTFVQKVRTAQNCDASAVIVVDKESTNWHRTTVQRVIMADDGNGSKINIPSMLLSYEDGKILEKFAGDDANNTMLELEWTMPLQWPVEVNLWTDAGQSQGNEFLWKFADHAMKLRGHMFFQPFYLVFYLPSDQDDSCLSDLQVLGMSHRGTLTQGFHGNDFCALQPMSRGMGPTTGHMVDVLKGKDVVGEDLRQLCLRNVTNVSTAEIPDSLYSEAFWGYQSSFWSDDESVSCKYTLPKMDEENSLETCSNKILKGLLSTTDLERVHDCTKGELGFHLLRETRENRAWNTLAVQINGARISGRMDADVVISAVCAACKNPTTGLSRAPECDEILAKVYVSEKPWFPEVGIQWSSIVIVVLFMFVIAGFLLYLFQRRANSKLSNIVRDEVMFEVRQQMQDYHNLDDREGMDNFDRSPNRPLVV